MADRPNIWGITPCPRCGDHCRYPARHRDRPTEIVCDWCGDVAAYECVDGRAMRDPGVDGSDGDG